MIRIKKSMCVQLLESVKSKDLTLSLVVKNPLKGNDYLNGDEVGLYSVKFEQDMWRIESDDSEKTCSLISDELKWHHIDELDKLIIDAYEMSDNIEILGYFVFDESSVLFYDIFKESVIMNNEKPFYLTPMLTMVYHSTDDEDFLSL